MDEEERGFASMSTADFDRETEEMLCKAGVASPGVLKELANDTDASLLNKSKPITNNDNDTETATVAEQQLRNASPPPSKNDPTQDPSEKPPTPQPVDLDAEVDVDVDPVVDSTTIDKYTIEESEAEPEAEPETEPTETSDVVDEHIGHTSGDGELAPSLDEEPPSSPSKDLDDPPESPSKDSDVAVEEDKEPALSADEKDTESISADKETEIDALSDKEMETSDKEFEEPSFQRSDEPPEKDALDDAESDVPSTDKETELVSTDDKETTMDIDLENKDDGDDVQLQSNEIDTSCTGDETEFVHVNAKNDKATTAEAESAEDVMDVDVDPIGDTETLDFDPSGTENELSQGQPDSMILNKTPEPAGEGESEATKGADEELCIIPDTNRVISQEEKDAATALNKVDRKATETGPTSEGKEPEEAVKQKENGEATASETEKASGDELPTHVADKTVSTTQESSTEENSAPKVSTPGTHPETSTVICLEDETEQTCKQCCLLRVCKYKMGASDKPLFFCSASCLKTYTGATAPEKAAATAKSAGSKFKIFRSKNDLDMREPLVFLRRCASCKSQISGEEKNLSWECMEFCNEDCLAKHQTAIGGNCANCKEHVPLPSLGKYCVRFGYDIRQFCSSVCLEDFKKGLKVCSYCQKDISGGVEGFLAPVGDKGQFKDFCTQLCMEKYDKMSNNHTALKTVAECDVCSNAKMIRLEIEVGGTVHKLCSEPCFVAFKFANNVSPEQCHMCHKYFEQTTLDYTIYFDNQCHNFCSKTCQNVYIITNRKIVPCQWCKVKKYNFDMIKKVCGNGQILMMCSINCFALYQVSVNAVSARNVFSRIKCDHCSTMTQAQYHLTMSDATIRNFCSYQCVMSFQNQFSKSPITITSAEKPGHRAVPAGAPKRTYMSRQTRSSAGERTSAPVASTTPPATQMPIITSVHSLAPAQTNGPSSATRSAASKPSPPPLVPVTAPTTPPIQTTAPPPPPLVKHKFIQQVIVKPAPVPEMKNKSTMCKPNTHTKGVSFKPHPCAKETQTDESIAKTVIIPVPVPIYVPSPMSLFSVPFPVPVPFPLPVPIPIFIPTTRNSANGIMKEIKKIQVKIPTDPFEAELLMMAEMVAGEKKVENTDSESDEDDNAGGSPAGDGGFSPEAVDTSNTFGDDMLQMALKMATELEEPAVDLEGALTANTITASQSHDGGADDPVDETQQMHHHAMMEARSAGARGGRKRQARQSRSGGSNSKRGRRMSGHQDMPMMPPPQPTTASAPPEPVEKPDANMCLKYTFGVNAWKQWVTTKNAELEKSTLPVKPFKPEILQLTADELNYSLCLFVKEVRKPNGSEYAPDTIYYLCLGIQQYLFENGRIDNIFTDAFYEMFTECLDEVARKFSVLYNDSHYIVTRVEEEHLWESKQLGAHSPHVLLSTLMFFNTKHFNLTTVDEHMQLSFSHIMKHWKRNPNQPGASKAPGSRNVLLRFYPPQASLEANARKKKVYEQQENEENPLRCPVKLYEFYLSKCPESVKTRNDVFYLLPERSCVPDSPVWYSTMALGRSALEKMLHRVKMVKEINVALLTS